RSHLVRASIETCVCVAALCVMQGANGQEAGRSGGDMPDEVTPISGPPMGAAPQQTSAASNEEAPSSSLLATTPAAPRKDDKLRDDPHALRAVSMFAIAPKEPRKFQMHDLVQIIVRETSTATSSSDLKTKKEDKNSGSIPSWPDFRLADLLQAQIQAGRTANTPSLEVDFTKDFKGQGDYQRKDDFAARVTAEVVEVMPNGNLVLEARTRIQTDKEIQSIKVTGVCRQEDVTGLNTVLSNQIHDLTVTKMNEGELKQVAEKGIIAKALETIFAF
ncbi:MAG TPA: flagellar basal body L-ring protein FlgH, partial [Phycisphaerales bacterium]|nr:flagellar basal body L-ring protein FlgH [Phycisphaerales bacterium]